MPENKNNKLKKSTENTEVILDELIKVFDEMIVSFKENLKPQKEE